MSKECICCGNKAGFLGGNQLSEVYDKSICDKCYSKFGVKMNLFRNSMNSQELSAREEDLVNTLRECDFINEGKQYIFSYIEGKKVEIKDNWINSEKQQLEEIRLRKEEEFKKIQFKENFDTHILTTGFNFENYKIKSYLGVISGSSVLGTGFFSEIGAGISDLLGIQSELFSEKIEKARGVALDKLKETSVRLGGNGIIGIDFDYIIFASNMIGVVANGTSVLIEKNE